MQKILQNGVISFLQKWFLFGENFLGFRENLCLKKT